MRHVFLLCAFIGATQPAAWAQRNYLFTTAQTNTVSNYSVIDLPELNGKPNAVFSVRTNDVAKILNPHPIGVWYTGQKWSIFNQDRALMPPGVTFLVTLSERAFVLKSDPENTRGAELLVNQVPLNGNADAKFSITQNWNPDGIGGTYNPSDIEARFDRSLGKWVLFNKSSTPIPAGAAFNIVELFDGEPSLMQGTTSNAATNKPEPLVSTTSSVGADPAIYQFLSSNRLQYPSVKQVPTLRKTFNEDGFTIKEMTSTSYLVENTVFNPPADVLYAGSVIQSEPYFKDNLLYPVSKRTTPGTITVVGGNGPGSGSHSLKLTENSLQAYKDGLAQILRGINLTNSVGRTQFFFKSCRSVEQGMVNLGINFRVNNFSGAAGLNSKNSVEKSYVVGLVKQVYYSVSYRPDNDLTNLFPRPTTLTELRSEGFVSNTNRPVYISQVDYGRMFLLVAESEASSDSLRMFLEANYRGGTVQAGGRFDYNSFKSRNSVNITVFSVGSNDDSKLADDITEQAFRTFLRGGATASLSNPGAPIAFNVRDFFGGALIPTSITAEYSDVMGRATPETYVYFVKPGEQGGQKNKTNDGRQLVLQRGDVISITATGRAKHGPWAAWEDKGPDGQANEATDPTDPMPCGANQLQRTRLCECNRFAIICNLPDLATTKKIWTCVGSGFPAKSVETTMTVPLNFTFNDFNTNDGYGEGYTITVTRIPYEQIIKERVSEKSSQ